MKHVKTSILVSISLLLLNTVQSQPVEDKNVLLDGYLIYLRPNWVFQPSEDSAADVLSSINSKSFVPGIFPLNFGVNLLPLEGFGKKMLLKYYNGFENTLQEDTVFYSFCRIKLILSADTSMNADLFPCRYKIYHGDKEYNLGCRYMMNAVEWVKPLDKADRSTYVDYLKSRDYPLPEWTIQLKDGIR